MKKIIKSLMIVIAILLAFEIRAHATELNLSINGEDTIQAGETKSVQVEVNADDQEVLSLSGVINTENIDTSSLNVEGINGWHLTYNSSEGNFIVYNENGSKSANILKITYKLNASAKEGKINVNNTNLTTIDYEETSKGNYSKTIRVSEPTPEPEEETPEIVDTKVETQGTEKIDTTVANTRNIPQTGATLIGLVAIASLVVISGIYYRKMKRIDK